MCLQRNVSACLEGYGKQKGGGGGRAGPAIAQWERHRRISCEAYASGSSRKVPIIDEENVLKMNFSVGVSMYSEKVTSYW